MKRRNVFALGLALAIGGAGSAFLVDGTIADSPPLLSLLSPPGAGYDSTAISLTTGSGGAVTFTRADTHTCQDSSGAIRSLASGQPCVVDGAALRVRSAVLNIAWQSRAIDAAPWSSVNVTAAAPTITADAAIGRDGITQNAEQIAFPAVALTQASARLQVFTGTAAVYSGGVWLKAASGTPTVYVWFFEPAVGTYANTVACALNATSYTLCKLENRTLTASASWQLRFGVDARDTGNQLPQSAFTVYAIDAQVVQAATLGDTCPTGAASDTCAAETATVATPATLSRTEGCVCANVTPSWTGAHPNAAGTIIYVSSVSTAQFLQTTAGSVNMRATDGTNTASVAADNVSGTRKRYCSRWSAAQNRLRVENVAAGTSNEVAFTTFPAFDATTAIGTNSNANLDSIVFGRSFGACQ